MHSYYSHVTGHSRQTASRLPAWRSRQVLLEPRLPSRLAPRQQGFLQIEKEVYRL